MYVFRLNRVAQKCVILMKCYEFIITECNALELRMKQGGPAFNAFCVGGVGKQVKQVYALVIQHSSAFLTFALSVLFYLRHKLSWKLFA